MNYQVQVKMNERLFLRDPEQSELGRRIVRQGILTIHELGFEDMTFRKLADRLGTKEASIYRYFENKHRLLLYLVTWYWRWREFRLDYETHNLTNPREKLDIALRLLLLHGLSLPESDAEINIHALHQVVMREASKAYLTRHVTEDNQQQFFKPYKDLCRRVADMILEYRPGFPFARSLASTVMEMAHYQPYFMQYLPSLTDFGDSKDPEQVLTFLRHLLFSSLEVEAGQPA
jgi:AcrR family transcriptional regulator